MIRAWTLKTDSGEGEGVGTNAIAWTRFGMCVRMGTCGVWSQTLCPVVPRHDYLSSQPLAHASPYTCGPVLFQRRTLSISMSWCATSAQCKQSLASASQQKNRQLCARAHTHKHTRTQMHKQCSNTQMHEHVRMHVRTPSYMCGPAFVGAGHGSPGAGGAAGA